MTEKPRLVERFVVEANRKVVGIAVRVRGGFKFFASDAEFAEAEAKVFPRARAMAQRIAAIARRRDTTRKPERTRLH